MYGRFNHSVDCSSSCKHVGFLQKNNSLDESSRILRSFKDGAARNLLSCDNGDPRFRRTEMDFSNLFARGRPGKASADAKNIPDEFSAAASCLSGVTLSLFRSSASQKWRGALPAVPAGDCGNPHQLRP